MHKLTHFVGRGVLPLLFPRFVLYTVSGTITGELSCIDSPLDSLSFMYANTCYMSNTVQNFWLKKRMSYVLLREEKEYRKYIKVKIIECDLTIMTIWLIRAGKNGEQERDALENDVCVIGWNELPDLSKIANKEELTNVYRQYYKDEAERSIAIRVNQILRFVNDVKIGDMVTIPLKSERSILIGKINGEYVYKRISSVIQHSRSVQWVGKIPRSSLREHQDILYSLGSRLTIARVWANDAENRINKILKNVKNISTDTSRLDHESTDNDIKDILDTSRLDHEILAKEDIIDTIDRNFKGHAFEHLIDSILRAKGFTTNVAAEGPDHGIDIFASQGFGDMSICVQVKSGKDPVKEHVVRDLRGACKKHNAKCGLLIAWGGINKSAEKEIICPFFEMEVWDHQRVLNEIFRNYEKLDDEIRKKLPLKHIMVLSDD